MVEHPAADTAEKVISLADARKRLRPPEPGSLAAALQNIETAFSQFGKKNDG